MFNFKFFCHMRNIFSFASFKKITKHIILCVLSPTAATTHSLPPVPHSPSTADCMHVMSASIVLCVAVLVFCELSPTCIDIIMPDLLHYNAELQ